MSIKWKEDSEDRNTVKIISETGSEVGEITITATKTGKKGSTIRKLFKLK